METGILRNFVDSLGLLRNSSTSEEFGIVRIYMADCIFPTFDPKLLSMIGLGRTEFILNVMYGELTHDPLAYDESLIMAMDQILVENLTSDEYNSFRNDHRVLRMYEWVYVACRRVFRPYVEKLLRYRDWSFDLNHTDRGYLIDIY